MSDKQRERRGLTKERAADYCGVTPAGFDDWVRKGIVPPRIKGTQRWDKKAIDAALDHASGIDESSVGKGSGGLTAADYLKRYD